MYSYRCTVVCITKLIRSPSERPYQSLACFLFHVRKGDTDAAAMVLTESCVREDANCHLLSWFYCMLKGRCACRLVVVAIGSPNTIANGKPANLLAVTVKLICTCRRPKKNRWPDSPLSIGLVCRDTGIRPTKYLYSFALGSRIGLPSSM